MGWFSRIERPLVRDASIALWRMFSGLDLSEAKTTKFKSMRDCFTRELKEGARPIDADPATMVSPCDAIVGACGSIAGTELLQVKGFPYTIRELTHDGDIETIYRNGRYVTLRLTSAMYHRFHAPHDCVVEEVTYISGDTWNVNPIALKRLEKLFCKNERALIRTKLEATGHIITLVPVAAILVASIRLHFLDVLLRLKHRGPNRYFCNAPHAQGRGDGMVRAGLDHHRVRARRIRALPRRARGLRDPHGSGADAVAPAPDQWNRRLSVSPRSSPCARRSA